MAAVGERPRSRIVGYERIVGRVGVKVASGEPRLGGAVVFQAPVVNGESGACNVALAGVASRKHVGHGIVGLLHPGQRGRGRVGVEAHRQRHAIAVDFGLRSLRKGVEEGGTRRRRRLLLRVDASGGGCLTEHDALCGVGLGHWGLVAVGRTAGEQRQARKGEEYEGEYISFHACCVILLDVWSGWQSVRLSWWAAR